MGNDGRIPVGGGGAPFISPQLETDVREKVADALRGGGSVSPELRRELVEALRPFMLTTDEMQTRQQTYQHQARNKTIRPHDHALLGVIAASIASVGVSVPLGLVAGPALLTGVSVTAVVGAVIGAWTGYKADKRVAVELQGDVSLDIQAGERAGALVDHLEAQLRNGSAYR